MWVWGTREASRAKPCKWNACACIDAHLLEFGVLLGWVGVIETHDEFALVRARKVLWVQQKGGRGDGDKAESGDNKREKGKVGA